MPRERDEILPSGPEGHADNSQWIGGEPKVLVFDVNETLIDFESMNPLFERVFGDKRTLREWLGHLVMYSMTLTLSGLYEEYFSLGRGLFRMVGDIHGVKVTDSDLDELETGMLTMPAHGDVEAGLRKLEDAGFRMVTLTNSPPNPGGKSPLESAGLAGFFERQFSIETVRAYKPAPSVYHLVAQELGVAPSNCFMVAAHVWDTVGAQSAGFTSGLITRPGNAPLLLRRLPQPHLVASDLPGLADRLIERWRS
ncbi:2-haloacid dehalogenase [Streptomyces sp. DvalAA-14]|uniref:haloacid dehalogenase type II n=1 Tax=unclassified Streptomyces TaxID=2593676 RepID=UPI00081BB3B0|nr:MULTISPECIES: haloacid dehalogenase type II [unclassified Streptomyces]MYS23697.1 haloacid dehalogenase type II [Streptomyces sp. SID4948]SCE37395.1 2-haloacid dehalogenase [Streptomyces sp. DvalAA-14]